MTGNELLSFMEAEVTKNVRYWETDFYDHDLQNLAKYSLEGVRDMIWITRDCGTHLFRLDGCVDPWPHMEAVFDVFEIANVFHIRNTGAEYEIEKISKENVKTLNEWKRKFRVILDCGGAEMSFLCNFDTQGKAAKWAEEAAKIYNADPALTVISEELGKQKGGRR